MPSFSEELEESWMPIAEAIPKLFTTQDYVDAMKVMAPETWILITDYYGQGGRGSGKFYSPANTVFNFLRRKADSGDIFERQLVQSKPGWGSPRVVQWELPSLNDSIPPDPGDIEFAEGGLMMLQHLARERRPQLRKKVLEEREKQGLSCDCCKRGAPHIDIHMQRAMFEVHHKRPLAEGVRATKINDVNLLCATCHRLIHRAILLDNRNVSAEELRHKLMP